MSNLMTLPDDLQPAAKALNQSNIKEQPKTMDELKHLLQAKGQQWIDEHKEIKSDGKVKHPLVPPSVVVNILDESLIFKMIGSKKDTSDLYFYDLDEGIYKSGKVEFNAFCRAIDNRLSTRVWREAYDHLKTLSLLVEPFNDRYVIPVNNGIFNLKKKTFEPFSPKYHITSKVQTNYNPDTKGVLKDKNGNVIFDIDQWMLEIANNDHEIYELLWQLINEAINPNYTRKKMAFLVGNGLNGKGTYQQLLINLIGANNISALKPLDYRSSDRFRTSTLVGKVCNIGDDIPDKYLDEISDLMSVVTGDEIMIERKHESSQFVKLQLLNIFSGNRMPKTSNKSYGLDRRMLIVPFNANFKGQKERPEIKEDYLKRPEILEYVLYKVLNMDFKKFIEPKAVKEQLEVYKDANDVVHSYYINCYIENDYQKLERVPIKGIMLSIDDFKRLEGHKGEVPQDVGKQIFDNLVDDYPNEFNYKRGRLRDMDKDILPDELKPIPQDMNKTQWIIFKKEE
ncbi:phage/plasmid primase, P4 family [Dolosigranulum pigrum]|uniref:phage/plasmid primase, P4 family n=1 Tax=Dolosigranulum pigrum TaxID=29394 RepID=UPI000DC4183F|nr:phage/plasmid primase, P4 family [Dolosigranulum pigrum]RAN53532.1 hypothetical protein B8A31_02820 [Dolosigranulum pigrum]